MEPYKPIDCDFHDRLEDAAIRQQVVSIVFLNDDLQELTEGVIKDIRIEDGAEVLIVNSKLEPIRLDTIISLNGVELLRQ